MGPQGTKVLRTSERVEQVTDGKNNNLGVIKCNIPCGDIVILKLLHVFSYS